MNEDMNRANAAPEHNTTITDAELDALMASILAEDDAGTAERYGHIPAAPVFQVPEEPAFEDPDRPVMPPDPPVVRNYSNAYGDDRARRRAKAKAEAQARAEAAAEDRWQIALMAVASVLCLGILGILIYWMQVFF